MKAIIGVGNRLMKDDGFGSCLAEVIINKVKNAVVVDLGLGNLLSVDLDKYDTVIIIDVANINEEYGIFKITSTSKGILEQSLHELGLNTILKLYEDKQFYIIVCKPEEIQIGYGLSKDCLLRIEKLIPEFKAFLKKLGIDADFNVMDIIEEIKERCVNTLNK
ncbi:Hydrogenase formation/expression factor related protein [Saccharolobus solfataricus P2]|uniref:Hydrogenase formation/expression factor related protein n=2 Tax=Saccharolobus solfataricus TaxID=2287 RepID=Q97YU4_SACS2|nr:hydrogenase maturation protease [Saccharolobus solfataricus]AAK41460.1 Hydrogenase formation/expression factor related protein [Saccharolobus solfataricus P2]SAI84867.1 hydrogenase expression protein [Saccharolobus solfataricus]